jgi:molybdopterin/thiamine biosynthesis adenylyltransferase
MDFLIHEREFRTAEILENRGKFNILVLGLGALGSNLIPVLIKNGFKNITGLDKDRIEHHNIGNQFYTLLDVGKKKTQVMAMRMHREMGLKIDVIDQDVFNVPRKVFEKFDLIIDSFDNWEARRFVKDICSELGLSDKLLHVGLSDSGYSEIKWDNIYRIPEIDDDQEDVCEYPLAYNLVSFTVSAGSEVICKFSDFKILDNISFTLNDLSFVKL